LLAVSNVFFSHMQYKVGCFWCKAREVDTVRQPVRGIFLLDVYSLKIDVIVLVTVTVAVNDLINTYVCEVSPRSFSFL